MKDYLKEYAKEIYPFHMPGHKLGRLKPLEDIDLHQIDVTEVDGTDNLHQADGTIAEGQKLASRLYGTKESYFLVNGSSCGLLAAISACTRPDGKILVSRNSHKSVYNAIYINRLKPYYIYPEMIESYGVIGGINPEKVKYQLEREPDIDCVCITSPTYEGFTSDIKSIAEIVHKKGKVLIVDEAHGAHFKLHSYFPQSAVEYADIVIHSVHKTLPSFTQSALLHVNSDTVDIELLKMYLQIYQTSSPSYILMTGINECLKMIEAQGKELWDNYVKLLDEFRNSCSDFENILLVGEEVCNKYGINNIDRSKLLFVGNNGVLNGKKLERNLRLNHNIQIEMATDISILALSSVADTEEGFTKLLKAIKIEDNEKVYINGSKFGIISHGMQVIRPFDALQRSFTYIDLKNAEGKIAAQFITPYPPGIPIIVPGEEITSDVLQRLTAYKKAGLTVHGLEEGTIKIIK